MKRVVLTFVGVIGLLMVTLLLRTFTFSSQQVQVTAATMFPWNGRESLRRGLRGGAGFYIQLLQNAAR